MGRLGRPISLVKESILPTRQDGEDNKLKTKLSVVLRKHTSARPSCKAPSDRPILSVAALSTSPETKYLNLAGLSVGVYLGSSLSLNH